MTPNKSQNYEYVPAHQIKLIIYIIMEFLLCTCTFLVGLFFPTIYKTTLMLIFSLDVDAVPELASWMTLQHRRITIYGGWRIWDNNDNISCSKKVLLIEESLFEVINALHRFNTRHG